MGMHIDFEALDQLALEKTLSDNIIAEAAEKNWIVDQYIARDSIAWFYGAPGSYKSFILMDMAMHIATGTPWMGRDVDQGPVLWLAAEGGVDVHYRRRAWEAKHGKRANIMIEEVGVNLLSEGMGSYIHEMVERRLQSIAITALESNLQPLNEEAEALEKEIEAHERALQADGARVWSEYLEANQDEVDQMSRADRSYLREKISNGVKGTLSQEEYRDKRGQLNRIYRTRASINKAIAGGQVDRYCDYTCDAMQAIRERYTPRLIVLDTFAQTSGNASTGPEVSEYIRRLKRTIFRVENGCAIAVIDHTTKSGDSYMGALAKEGDSDLMAKIEIQSDLLSAIKTRAPHGKLKFAAAPDDIAIALESHSVIDSDGQPLTDPKGREITTLICADGAKKMRLAEIAKADANSAQALLLALLQEHGEPVQDSEIRALFLDLPAMQEKKPATAKQAYLRAKKALYDEDLISISDDDLITVI